MLLLLVKKASGGADSAIALGQGASSTNQNSIAIGTNSQATAYNGVAIGAYSVANTAGGVAGFNPNTSRTDTYSGLTGRALTSTTGAVAIGSDSQSRQLTGLAAGTADTDAVNVAQLKSVNLAFKGNAGTGDVNLAAHPLTIQGNDNYITTSANGNTINISGKVQNITVTNGTATAANKGMADAQNVADAINNAVQSNAYKWKLTANGEATPETIAKDDTVDFSGDTNISVARNGKKITTSLKKDITVDSVKANKSITTGSGSNQITLDGTSGAVIGRTFSGQSFAAGDNVLSNTTLQIGSTTNGNNVTITKDGITSKAGSTIAKFGATGIDAGGQRITNVSSGGNVGTNAANITDVKNAVSDVTLKLDTNSKTGTVKLSDGSLKIVGANGIRTDLTGTNKDNLVIGLDSNTVNATTKGIGLSGDSGTMLRKFLKDGDADFKISGDGGLVTTSGTTTGVQVSVDKSKVKDLAVEAVTVSKANTVDNPITVTPTADTNSKDYAIGIDTTKLAAKTNLAYTANGGTAKTVSLAKGLNFVNGTNTVSSVDSDGKVSFDLNQATKDSINKSATAVGRTITLNADSGTGSSQSLSNGNVSFAVSGVTGDYISTIMDGSAVKVSTKRATINSDANTGAASVTGADGLATAKNVASAINSAVNGLSQNLNISDGTNNSSVALKNQKLTVTGTGAAKATVNGQTITIDVAEGTLTPNTTNGTVTGTTGVAKATEVAAAINNTNTVLGNKITKNTQDIATNTSNITANKNQITTNTTNIATNTTNIAHTIALADDKGTSTTAKSLKDGNVSFNIKGDNKFISTAASGNDVTLTVNEQAIKDAAKSASSFKVKANAHAEEEVKGRRHYYL
ncbi:MAG: beta strand repeat-containing protein [Veillonella atypica]